MSDDSRNLHLDQVFFILLVVVGLNQWVNSQSSDPHSNLPLQRLIIYFLFLDLKVQSISEEVRFYISF